MRHSQVSSLPEMNGMKLTLVVRVILLIPRIEEHKEFTQAGNVDPAEEGVGS